MSVETDGIIDQVIFDQLLDMDEPDDTDREFSRGIILNYFEQAEETFCSIDIALKEKNLLKVSRLGHFLKGSSAVVGIIKVRDSCERIQRIGELRRDSGVHANSPTGPSSASSPTKPGAPSSAEARSASPVGSDSPEKSSSGVLSETDALSVIEKIVAQARLEYKEAETALKKMYGMSDQ
ncbi:signal transduction histidine kinase [Cladochytrium replicatum]|nr:signal transduction histidine kinase [Cladochytrium replicatum]